MKRRNVGLSRYLFLLPGFLIYASVVIFPTFYSLYLSFFKWNGVAEKEFVGFSNYATLFFEDNIFWIALKNNITWIVLTTIITISVALLMALVLNRAFKGRVVYRAIFYFPYMLSMIVVGIIWKWMYNPNTGIINSLLDAANLSFLKLNWLTDPKVALYAIYAAALWQGVGQPMLLFLAGLQTIPADLMEAAKIDGAGSVKAFFHITVPMLKDTLIVVFAILIIASMKVYDIINAMTGGGPANSTQTLASYMYSQSFRYSNYGIGSAVACIMLLIMAGIIIPYVRHIARDE